MNRKICGILSSIDRHTLNRRRNFNGCSLDILVISCCRDVLMVASEQSLMIIRVVRGRGEYSPIKVLLVESRGRFLYAKRLLLNRVSSRSEDIRSYWFSSLALLKQVLPNA
jgi:hypothetical protein